MGSASVASMGSASVASSAFSPAFLAAKFKKNYICMSTMLMLNDEFYVLRIMHLYDHLSSFSHRPSSLSLYPKLATP
jgi:hypothetical protein